jgi:hypothetical protein
MVAGSGSKEVLHEEGTTAGRMLDLDGDEERWSMVVTVSRGDDGREQRRGKSECEVEKME